MGKRTVKRLNKRIFIALKKADKVIKLIAGPMAEVQRGGENNKMNVLGPTDGLIMNYDKALGFFKEIPNERFETDTVSITEIKRIIQSVQNYKLKNAVEEFFSEEDPNQKAHKKSSIKKHIGIITDMLERMRAEKIKTTA